MIPTQIVRAARLPSSIEPSVIAARRAAVADDAGGGVARGIAVAPFPVAAVAGTSVAVETAGAGAADADGVASASAGGAG